MKYIVFFLAFSQSLSANIHIFHGVQKSKSSKALSSLSYSQWSRQQSLQSTYPDQFNRFFQKAQSEYLLGSLNESERFFQKVVDLSYLHSWNENQRKAIVYSYLRLAQMKNQNRHKWVQAAVDFDSSAEVQHSYFPPEIQKLYWRFKHQVETNRIPWNPLNSYPHALWAFVNGKSFDLQEKELILLPADSLRIEIFFDQKEPLVFVGKTTEFLQSPPTSKNLLQGDCKSLRWLASAPKVQTRIFMDGCEKLWTGQNWKSNPSLNQQLHLNVSNSIETKLQDESFLGLSSRQWLYVGIGAAVVTGIVLIVRANQKKDSATNTSVESPPDTTRSSSVVIQN